MLPTYQPSQILIGLRWFRPRPGQVVVAQHQGRPIIKRLTALTATQAWLHGDNPAQSTDSRHFGPLPRRQLQARILFALPKMVQ